MKSRLVIFLQAEQITASRLAEILGVQASSISHILSERNKPGYDFLFKLFTAFPRLNPRWLILGSGEMYSDDNRTLTPIKRSNEGIVATLQEPASRINNANLLDFGEDAKADTGTDVSAMSDIDKTSKSTISENHKRNIDKIVIFYDDNTFESYNK